ncbi:MAG: SMC family ATPase [Pyrobaculum sp.]
MIKKVELVNFKAHGRGVFKFVEGVNFIHGPNGAGKTSLMEAIAVGLFGSQWVKKTGGRWGDYLKRGASYGEVKIYLTHGGEEWVVARRFGEGGTSPSGTYLSINGAVVARGDVEVSTTLFTKTGLGVDEFRHLLYIRQGELRRILQEPEYIDKVMRLDEFDKVDEVVKEIYGELRGRRERVSGRLEELEKRSVLLKERLVALRRKAAELEERAASLEKVEREYAAVEGEYLRLREAVASLTKERESLEKRLEELANYVVEVERGLEELERELAMVKKAREELASLPEVGDVEKELYELKRAVAAAERLPEELKRYDPARLSEARRRLEEALARQAEVKSRLEILRGVLKVAKYAEGGRCPVCGSPLSIDVVRRHEFEAAGLEREENRLREAVESLREEVRRLEELDRLYQANREYLSLDLDTAKRRLKALEELYSKKREVERLRAYLSAVVAREGELEKKLAELLRRRGELGEAMSTTAARLSEVEKRLAEAQAALGRVEGRYREMRQRYEELLAVRAALAELRREVAEAERELAAVSAELERGRGELAKLDKAVATAENIRRVLREVKPLARQIVARAVNEELNAVFLKLRHKESFKSIQLVESDGRYSIVVHTASGQVEHRLLSIGEQNLAALALRVALARALLGWAPFIMFDEPTEHLDEEHRRRVVELVRDLTSIVPVVIVTSHLGEFEEVADLVIQL